MKTGMTTTRVRRHGKVGPRTSCAMPAAPAATPARSQSTPTLVVIANAVPPW